MDGDWTDAGVWGGGKEIENLWGGGILCFGLWLCHGILTGMGVECFGGKIFKLFGRADGKACSEKWIWGTDWALL